MQNENSNKKEDTSLHTHFPIDLKHYGAISTYVGFFSLIFSLAYQSNEGLLLSSGLICLGIGELIRRPRYSTDHLDEKGRLWTETHYHPKSISNYGDILSFLGCLIILIAVCTLVCVIIIKYWV